MAGPADAPVLPSSGRDGRLITITIYGPSLWRPARSPRCQSNAPLDDPASWPATTVRDVPRQPALHQPRANVPDAATDAADAAAFFLPELIEWHDVPSTVPAAARPSRPTGL